MNLNKPSMKNYLGISTVLKKCLAAIVFIPRMLNFLAKALIQAHTYKFGCLISPSFTPNSRDLFAVWATEMSRTVKQPIRAELNMIIHDPSK